MGFDEDKLGKVSVRISAATVNKTGSYNFIVKNSATGASVRILTNTHINGFRVSMAHKKNNNYLKTERAEYTA